MWLTAIANLLPAAGKFLEAVASHDDKATTAAHVATDPNAPAAVKQAATNVASQAIADRAAAEQAALGAVTGKAPKQAATGSSTGTIIAVVGLLLLMGKRRR